MKKNIVDFLKSKKIEYKVVKENEFYDFFNQYEDNLEIGITNTNRDHVFAIYENKVIACATLFNQENSARIPLKNVITLSNIRVNKDFKNKGIASNMIDILLDDIKKQNKILNRTDPDLEGKLYIYNKIKEKSKDKGVLVIPHNLTFIYSKIANSKQHKELSYKDKISLMHNISKKMLEHKTFKEWNITDIEEVNHSFNDALEDVWNDINKPTQKRKIQKP